MNTQIFQPGQSVLKFFRRIPKHFFKGYFIKNKMFLLLFVLALGSVFVGCTSRLGSFTIVSTKNIDFSRMAEYSRSTQRVSGEDVLHIIIIFPTKMNVTIEDAVDRAIQEIPGGIALVDAVIRHTFFYIPWLAGQESFTVEGNVLIDPKLARASGKQIESSYLLVYANNKDEFTRKELTEKEYGDIQKNKKLIAKFIQ